MNQAVEEIRRNETENYKKFLTGDLTPEAYKGIREETANKLLETKKLGERAADLNLIESRSVQLRDEVRKPNLTRAVTSMSDGASAMPTNVPGELLEIHGEALSEAHFEALSRKMDIFLGAQSGASEGPGPLLPMGSPDRVLLNKFLRPSLEGMAGCDIRNSLTKKEIEHLTRPRTERLMNPYVDSAGGWVVAEEMRNEMISLRTLATGITSRFRTIATTAGRVSFPTSALAFDFGKRDRTGRFNITVERLIDVWGKTEFQPAGRDKIITVPEQLIEDATQDIVRFIAEEANRISDEEDELLGIIGSGNSEPLGYLNGLIKLYDALDVADQNGKNVGIDPVASDNVPDFTGAEINEEFIQIFHTYVLPATARGNAVWTGPPEFERRVMLFRTKPAGDNTGSFMWRPAAFAGAPETLNTKPLLISQFFPNNFTTGSEGDPLFHYGDLRDMWWIVRSGLRLRVLNELFAQTGEIGYKWQKRQDGGLVRPDGNIFARRQADAP